MSENSIELVKSVLTSVRTEVAKVIVGQEEVIEKALIVILMGQHALIEGVPGVAKTLLVRTLAKVLSCEFNRIQFTPDLMPADITGTSVYNLQTNEFNLLPGPIFTTFLLADEINRAPAKTQSALLQAMQERHISIDRHTYDLGNNFTVFATQNPVEYEGTYPLAEAQKDRFALKIQMPFPERDAELVLARRMLTNDSPENALTSGKVNPVLTIEQLQEIRTALSGLLLREEILAYILDIVRATRVHQAILVGAGPRATQSLILASRASAAVYGHDFVSPDDVRSLIKPVLEHRIILRPEYEIEGLSIPEVLDQILQSVPCAQMIVPRLLLIGISIVLGIPLVGGIIEFSSLPLAVALVFILIVVVVDALMGLNKVQGVEVSLPEKCRWIHGRKAFLPVVFTNKTGRQIQVRAAIGFPMEIEPESDQIVADLAIRNRAEQVGSAPAKSAESLKTEVLYPCTPLRRGLLKVEKCNYEITSPLGLWDIRSSNPASTLIRSYPNLQSERRQMAALFLRNNQLGMKLTRQVGQGRDFEKLRDYTPGDSFDRIHWKATARRRHPVTKVFQVEKTQQVYVIIDFSRLSGRFTVPEAPNLGTHLDRYILSALVMGLVAENQGDLFGLMTFADRVHSFISARKGKDHFGACREALYRLEPSPVSPDFQEVMSTIRLRIRRRALIVFLTDLDDPVLGESFSQAVELISKQHLVLVQMLQPPGSRPLFTNQNISRSVEVYQQLGQHMAWNDLRQLSLQLKRHGVTLNQSNNEQFSARMTSEYLKVKQRQLI